MMGDEVLIRCTKCGKMRRPDEFYYYKIGSRCGQRRSFCKKCEIEGSLIWQDKNIEKAKKNKRNSSRRFRKLYPKKNKMKQKKSYKKAISELRDSYIKNVLTSKEPLLKAVDITPELVEMKRGQILLWREIRNLKKGRRNEDGVNY